MDYRVRAIVALLVDRDRYTHDFAGALTSTGALVASAAQSGPGPSEKRLCVHCDGIRRVVGRRSCATCAAGQERPHQCSPCPSCTNGYQWIDSYTSQVVAAPEPRSGGGVGGAHVRRRGRSSRDFGDQVHRLDAAHRRQDAATSQHALTVALEQLRDHDAVGYSLLLRTYSEGRYQNGRGPLDHVDRATRLRLAEALVFVSQRMPDELVLPGPLEERIQAGVRDDELRRLRAEGVSIHELSRRYGMRRQRVKALLLRRI